MSDKKTVIEKERKWLLKKLPELNNLLTVINITQYYKDGWRYRMEHEAGKTPEFIKLKKQKIEKGVNKEVDIEKISQIDFYNNRIGSREDRREIIKKRYVLTIEDRKFEIDLFHGLTLIIMEVENISAEEKIIFPEEIEKVLLMEVTGNSKFDNYNLGL